MLKLGEKHQHTKPTDEQIQAAAVITEELTKCMARVMGHSDDVTGP